MTDPTANDENMDAGEFGQWLEQTLAAQKGGEAPDVPCGDCDACCRSSQFIHIGANETQALRVIDDALLFDAPGSADGTKLMGFDEEGRCPQLKPAGCQIYAARPRTCRQYDCRIFAAAGMTLDNPLVVDVAARVSKWTFRYADVGAQARHDAVKRAAKFLREKRDAFVRPPPPSEIFQALLALRVHELFLADAPPLDDKRLAAEIMDKNQAFTGD